MSASRRQPPEPDLPRIPVRLPGSRTDGSAAESGFFLTDGGPRTWPRESEPRGPGLRTARSHRAEHGIDGDVHDPVLVADFLRDHASAYGEYFRPEPTHQFSLYETPDAPATSEPRLDWSGVGPRTEEFTVAEFGDDQEHDDFRGDADAGRHRGPRKPVFRAAVPLVAIIAAGGGAFGLIQVSQTGATSQAQPFNAAPVMPLDGAATTSDLVNAPGSVDSPLTSSDGAPTAADSMFPDPSAPPSQTPFSPGFSGRPSSTPGANPAPATSSPFVGGPVSSAVPTGVLAPPPQPVPTPSDPLPSSDPITATPSTTPPPPTPTSTPTPIKRSRPPSPPATPPATPTTPPTTPPTSSPSSPTTPPTTTSTPPGTPPPTTQPSSPAPSQSASGGTPSATTSASVTPPTSAPASSSAVTAGSSTTALPPPTTSASSLPPPTTSASGPPPAAASAPQPRTLSPGATGPDVTALQQRLNRLIQPSWVPVSGIYDSQTAKAVAQVQQLLHVVGDLPGVCGPATSAAVTAATGAA
jgi:hypothetical protein